MTRLLIADDHDLVRDTLGAFLQNAGGFDLCLVQDHPSALEKIDTEGPYDLVLLDLTMPGMNGLNGLGQALSANGGQGVAIMSGNATKTVAQEALDAGAIGFLPKTMGAQSLVNAVRFMAMGEKYVPFDFMNAEEEAEEQNPLAEKLSPRERQVLVGLGQGLANKEIARELELQEVTVKLHVKTLCRKLDAKNRTQAAMIAKEAGII